MANALSPNSPAFKHAARFHGHICPGLAIGCRMALAALKALDLDASPLLNESTDFSQKFSPDEELVCVAETDACCVDGIQALLGCTLGKGNLLLKLRGKTAMSFYHRPSQKAVRILWRANLRNANGEIPERGEIINHFLEAPEDELLEIKTIPFAPPQRAIIARSLPCVKCGEKTAEYALRFRDGRPYCLDCWPEPSRIL